MPRYELDEYVQEHVADDDANVSCVASWRARVDAEGRVESLLVDLHNSWQLNSKCWNGAEDVPGRILRALRRNERGRVGTIP
jgi:hypothetical protein